MSRMIIFVSLDTAGGMGRHLGIFDCTMIMYRLISILTPFSRLTTVGSVGNIIGTGIFSTPSSIIGSVGSAGVSLMLWVFGFVLSFCGLFVWLELGTMIPRSGGEKVYLEAIYRRPKNFATVIYATNIIVLSFSSGNCLVCSPSSPPLSCSSNISFAWTTSGL